MIKNTAVKALAVLIALALLVPAFTVYAENANPEEAPAFASEERALKMIYELAELLDGRYFTTNNKPCSDNSCDKCYNENVIKCSWFSELFGYTVKASQLPYYYFPDGSFKIPKGWSCFGFAAFAQWYIFAESPEYSIGKNVSLIVSPKTNSSAKFDYDTLNKYARPGDIIRVQKGTDKSSGHSMIFISCNKTGATVLDSNFIENDLVGIHTIPFKSNYGSVAYASCPVAITRSNNYDTLAPFDADAESEIIFTDMNAPVCHTAGKSFAMRGLISSVVKLSEVKCVIKDAVSGDTVYEYTEKPNAFSLSLKESQINSNTKFSNFSKGLYILEYTATDAKGYSAKWSSLKFSISDESHICKYGEHTLISLPKDGVDGEIIYTCSLCGCECKMSFSQHIYTDECDADCDACGEMRVPPHRFDKFECDAYTHTEVCSLCGEKMPAQCHSLEGDICTVCGYIADITVIFDYDGDGELTTEDSIYFLYHIFFPELYPIEKPCDFDQNGTVDTDDAIYLLYHIYFADKYPI